ncbi:MAG TPA: preprotein translocase subunit YajC [Microlunatus sp.]
MGNSPVSTILLIALMVVAFYFLLLRPQKKRQQAQQKTMNEIVPGTRVLLGSGIFGTVISAGEKQAVLETSPGVHVTVLKQAIARVIRPGDEFSEPLAAEDELDEIADPAESSSLDTAPEYDTPSTYERPADYDPLASRDQPVSYDRPVADNPTLGNEPKNKD